MGGLQQKKGGADNKGKSHTVSDVDAQDRLGASLEQPVGEPARRQPAVHRPHPAHVDAEPLQGRVEFEAAAADEPLLRGPDLDARAGRDLVAGLCDRDAVDEHLAAGYPGLDDGAGDGGPGYERRGLVEAHAALLVLLGGGCCCWERRRPRWSRGLAVVGGAVDSVGCRRRRMGQARRALGDSAPVVAAAAALLAAFRSAASCQRSLQDRLEAAQGDPRAPRARKRLRKSQCPSDDDGIAIRSSSSSSSSSSPLLVLLMQRATAPGDPRCEAHGVLVRIRARSEKEKAKKRKLASPRTRLLSNF